VTDPWQALGWTANACFFSRFLVQWWRSEKAGESVTPRLFWFLSVAGSVLGAAYTLLLGERVLLLGYLINLAIYLRNLSLREPSRHLGGPLLSLGALTAVALVATMAFTQQRAAGTPIQWITVAALGQTLWNTRFVVQWLHAERTGRSELPPAFWWISLVANGLLLAYTIQVGKPALIAGYAIGPLVQVRNLMLLARRPSATKDAGTH